MNAQVQINENDCSLTETKLCKTPMLLHISEAGGFTAYLWDAPHRRQGVYIFSGYLTNQAIGQRFGIVHKEIDLLVAVS